MVLRFSPTQLRLRHPFTISRGSRTTSPSVVVEIEHGGIVGIGEAAPSPRYGESPETVIQYLRKVDLAQFEDPMSLDKILMYLETVDLGNASAKAAIDIALHDWNGKRMGVPLWKLWGLNPLRVPLTSYTIGIDSPEMVDQKVKEAELYPILKVKLGVENDMEIIRRIRSSTGKRLRVDANEGWKTKHEAKEKILWLQEQGVELVEQPLPVDDLEGTAWLREEVGIPIIADENARTSADLPKLQYVFDGVNIKLMKCGGLREAMRMILAAKILGMKIMIGCMIESSVAISAAAQLAPLADYADLDGNLLIADDPYAGVCSADGSLPLQEAPGIGAAQRH